MHMNQREDVAKVSALVTKCRQMKEEAEKRLAAVRAFESKGLEMLAKRAYDHYWRAVNASGSIMAEICDITHEASRRKEAA